MVSEFDRPIPWCTYSVGHMHVFIELVLSAAVSLHGASHVLHLLLPLVDATLPIPSWSSGRWWLLRVGLYKLTRPKVVARDWIWILDHTLQIGPEKCLLIVGVRCADLPPIGQSLRYCDLEPLALFPVTTSNGEVVQQQLEATCAKTGEPRQIVADAGSDLKRGIRLFCGPRWHCAYTYDIKHKTAILLKHELANDAPWHQFLDNATATKQRLQQTALAFLAPPAQRSKARYLNVSPLVQWGHATLQWLTWQESTRSQDPEQHDHWDQILHAIGWLRDYQEALDEWMDLMTILDTATQVVRTEGVARATYSSLKRRLAQTGQTPRTLRIRTELLEWFAREVCFSTNIGERLVGSSEVLESLFGRFKHLEQAQAHSGFTPLLLGLPALLASTTADVIQQAMEHVSVKDVQTWCRTHLGQSVQAQRKEVFNMRRQKEEK